MPAGGAVCTYLYACSAASACVSVSNPMCAWGHTQGRASRLQHWKRQAANFPMQSVSLGIPHHLKRSAKHLIFKRNTTKHAVRMKDCRAPVHKLFPDIRLKANTFVLLYELHVCMSLWLCTLVQVVVHIHSPWVRGFQKCAHRHLWLYATVWTWIFDCLPTQMQKSFHTEFYRHTRYLCN